MADLTLHVRYYRHGTDDGVECREEHFRHAERQWSVPAAQAALVLLDCWAEHFIKSHEARSGRIMREVLKPALAAARKAGITVVHAPSATYIKAYPQWVAYASDKDLGLEPAAPPDPWPPPDFRRKEGIYAQFAKPQEPKVKEWVKTPGHYRICELLGPQPGDFVIANGDQLHRLLKHRKILHLFYAGFATNICILFRDYGTRAMSQRGYNVCLLRDCTVAIESHESLDGMWLTRAAIHTVETQIGHSTTAAELIRACAAIHQAPASPA